MKDYHPEKYENITRVIFAKSETQTELQHVVSEQSEQRLKERMLRQKTALENLSTSLAWDW